MKIKVCGITQVEQFKQLNELGVDFVGFIFYPLSKRYAGESRFNQAELLRLQTQAKATAVFVNPTMDDIKNATTQLPNIKIIQLHGNEDPLLCKHLQLKYEVIKAISIAANTDLKTEINKYRNCCNYFLFDTATIQYGGSGQKFDWSIFKNQIIPKPFFLSGGIGIDDVNAIKKFTHPAFFGIDINSKFEIEPGIKNLNTITEFIKLIKK